MNVTPCSAALSRVAKGGASSHLWPKGMGARQISDTFSPGFPMRWIFMRSPPAGTLRSTFGPQDLAGEGDPRAQPAILSGVLHVGLEHLPRHGLGVERLVFEQEFEGDDDLARLAGADSLEPQHHLDRLAA